jgi:peptidoglycan-N-acetylglucosamine deacetylase
VNILTFDIEDWYNCDFVTSNYDWDKYEVRIYEGVERILRELGKRELKATFFCLGWIAEKHPDVIRFLHAQGHHIGCHSYQHELTFDLDPDSFRENTKKSKNLIEDLIGESINVYRAPGFSITEHNMWALEILVELGFQYDCSIFPALHDYGGFDNFGKAEPAVLKFSNGLQIKEFPINNKRILTKNFVFSGGGYFRFYPYWLIKYWARRSPYLMTYFHSRDFDPSQPILQSLSPMRKFKSYVGLSTSFVKFQKLLDDFNFVNVENADKLIDWDNARALQL